MRFAKLFLKGLLCGVGTMIPGVSGGTIAVLLGVFEPLLGAVSSVFRHFFASFLFLLPFASGAAIGAFAVSFPLSLFCSRFPLFSRVTFCILSAVSLVLFVGKITGFRFCLRDIPFLLGGTLIAFLLDLLLSMKGFFSADGVFPLLLCGIILALALILPAVSFSYMLLFFGLYEKTLAAVGSFELLFLLPLLFGILLGIFAFSSLLEKLIEKYPRNTYCFTAGFVVCSFIGVLF